MDNKKDKNDKIDLVQIKKLDDNKLELIISYNNFLIWKITLMIL